MYCAPGIEIGDSGGLLSHSSLAGLRGNIVSDLSPRRRIAHQRPVKLLDLVDQELPEAWAACALFLLFLFLLAWTCMHT